MIAAQTFDTTLSDLKKGGLLNLWDAWCCCSTLRTCLRNSCPPDERLLSRRHVCVLAAGLDQLLTLRPSLRSSPTSWASTGNTHSFAQPSCQLRWGQYSPVSLAPPTASSWTSPHWWRRQPICSERAATVTGRSWQLGSWWQAGTSGRAGRWDRTPPGHMCWCSPLCGRQMVLFPPPCRL